MAPTVGQAIPADNKASPHTREKAPAFIVIPDFIVASRLAL
jgi:hypothetical protein